LVNGKRGAVLGASNREGRAPARPKREGRTPARPNRDGWRWEKAGEYELPLPQAIRLDFAKPSTVREVRLTFDSDLPPWYPQINPYPKKLVKSYRLEGFDGKDWRVLADEKENPLRHRIHRFAPCRLELYKILA